MYWPYSLSDFWFWLFAYLIKNPLLIFFWMLLEFLLTDGFVFMSKVGVPLLNGYGCWAGYVAVSIRTRFKVCFFVTLVAFVAFVTDWREANWGEFYPRSGVLFFVGVWSLAYLFSFDACRSCLIVLKAGRLACDSLCCKLMSGMRLES